MTEHDVQDATPPRTGAEELGLSGETKELGELANKPFRVHELVAVVRDDGTVLKMRVYGQQGKNNLILRRVPGEIPTKFGHNVRG